MKRPEFLRVKKGSMRKRTVSLALTAAMVVGGMNAVPMTADAAKSDEVAYSVLAEVDESTLVTTSREERVDRAVVAMDLAGRNGAQTNVTATDAEGNEYTEGVYMSWRSYNEDFNSDNKLTTTFTVYKNGDVLAENLKVTNLIDPEGSAADTYKVVGSNDEALELTAKDVKPWVNKYLEIELNRPADQTMPDGNTTTYTANDMSLGDLDGDGVLDLIVKWYPSNAQDNSKGGYTGTTILDGYTIDYATGDAEQLWRIDMGINIRSGAHYTQFQVWDYDGDGKAEIAVRTSEGTTTYKNVEGTLTETGHVGEYNAEQLPTNTITAGHDFRNSSGYIFNEPEKFTIFNGEDGTIIDTVDYTPGRGTYDWGDTYGNRSERYLSGTAYLNGETPFAVFCRGYYTRTALTAYYLADTDADGIGDKIATYWAYDTYDAETGKKDSQYEAQGNHALGVYDVDGDGMDEIIYGALTIDHDGTVLYSTGLGHGDAQHTSDWVSWNDGMEIMSVHEHDDATYHVEVRDAATGEILMGYNTGKDTGRGVASDIDPTAEGAEWWSIASPTYEDNDEPAWNSTNGEVYSSWSSLDNFIKLADTTPASNGTIFWDGDLLAEIQDGTFNEQDYVSIGTGIYKWDYENEQQVPLLYSEEILTNNGTKQNVGMMADFLGDWREEIITRSATNASKVRIYSTTIETDYVLPCLLEDLAYREGVAWQNVGYNQPAHVTYMPSQGAVTAQLSEGDISDFTASSTILKFTPANDGDLYGLDIVGYNIYRSADGETYEWLDNIAAKPSLLDVEAGWKMTAAQYVFDKGLMSGVDTDENGNVFFSPDTQLKREMLAQILYAAENKPEYETDKSFVDVDVNDPGAWYAKAVLWAAENGIVSGVGEGMFGVDQNITREQLALMLYKYAEYKGYDVTGTVELDTYVDVASVHDWAETAMKWAVSNGVMSGKPVDGGMALAPEGEASRVECAAMMRSFWLKFVDKDAETSDVYTYVDSKDLVANTEYSYKVAAVVATPDGTNAISHMSRPITLKTAVAQTTAPVVEKVTLVEGTPIPANKTVEALLPAEITVTGADGNEYVASIDWDVENIDINTVGEYTVTASVRGWSEAITATVEVVANAFDRFEEVTKETLQGVAPALPNTITVYYTNTTTEEKAVTWDTSSLDLNTIATVTVTGTVEGMEEKATATVMVRENYITAIAEVAAEVEFGTVDVAAVLPATVSATWADKTTSNVNVTWDVTSVNTTKAGTYTVTGKVDVEDCTIDAVAKVTVTYPTVGRYDFGIDANRSAEGWTTVTVNPKGGKATMASLGSNYTAERGYGFLNADATIDGRTETYEFVGTIPANVYTDFALPGGQTFVVDIEDGIYAVEFISGSTGGADGVSVTVEDTYLSFKGSKNTCRTGSVTVEVADGQLTCAFASGTIRCNGFIIRQISDTIADKTVLKEKIAAAEDMDGALYTEESYSALLLAIKSASTVADTVGASQEDVDAAAEALEAAVNALVSNS